MVNDLDSVFKSFNDLAAKTDKVIESVEEAYGEDGANELSEDELRTALLNGTVTTDIAVAGASASCGKPTLSDCGRFAMAKDSFISTGLKLDKIFLMALGNIAPADKRKRPPFNIREPASDVHMVPGIKHNLLSMNQFAEAKYITIFDEDEVNIYDATNTEVRVSRGSVLRGWRLRDEGLWRIPLVKNVQNENTETILVNKPPSSFLANSKQPPTDKLLNAYKTKTRPELVGFSSCGRRISNQTNLAGSYQKQTLCILGRH